MQYSFTRYLAAKKTVDDRALNSRVFDQLKQAVDQVDQLRCLEIGAGVGTMLERLLERGVFKQAIYLGLDSDPDNVHTSWQRLPEWGTAHGFEMDTTFSKLFFRARPEVEVLASLQCMEVLEFCTNPSVQAAWDLLVAHAFLDLFDLPTVLPRFVSLLRPGGLAYFTINFDGDTIFEPVIDPAFDAQIIQLYHRSMDERIIDGKPSGDSRAGRRLFSLLRQNGMEITASGASDWVVYPGKEGYPGDEAYFLHHILHFFEQTLLHSPELDQDRLRAWLTIRHAQVDQAELVYIAHQLDFLAQKV